MWLLSLSGFVALCLVTAHLWQRPLSDEHILRPSAYGLPPLSNAYPEFEYYAFPNATGHISYYPGRGYTSKGARWHAGRIMQECEGRCAITVFNQYHTIRTAACAHNAPTVLYGQSLGTHTVLQMYEEYRSTCNLTGIILENPFTSPGGFLGFPLLDVLLLHWNNNMRLLERVDTPVLILTSENDEIVPPRMSREVMAALVNAQVEQQIIPGAYHGHAMVGARLREWLSDKI